MEKRAITAEDLVKLKFVGSPQVSPTKDKAAYVLTQMDKEKNGYYSSIYVTDMSHAGKAFTFHFDKEKLIKDTFPRWSPTGEKLAFLSNRTGKNQIWMLDADGGEAQPLTELEQGIMDFAWTPDGKQMIVSVRGEIEQKDENKEEKAEDKKKEEKSDVVQITRLRYKMDGAGFLGDKTRRIYLFDLDTKAYKLLSDAEYDFMSPSISPDGSKVVYVGSKDENIDLKLISDLYIYDLQSGEEKLLFEGQGGLMAPSFSPDGKYLAYAGHDRGGDFSGNTQVWVYAFETGERFNLTSSFDYTVGNLVGVDAKYDGGAEGLVWDTKGEHIYFIATVGGDVQLFKVDLKGNVSEALSAAEHTITSFDMISDDEALIVQANPFSTGDLKKLNIKNGQVSQLTDFNAELLDEIELSKPEVIKYKSTDGWEIEGWIMKPYSFTAGKKYPLILQIHGGPHTAYGNGLHHEMQLMAAKGYVVLYTNPRGSHGYGHDFVRAVVGDYGGMDYTDIMAGVDYAIETFDYIDTNQLFVTGGSYGGYMTNTIVTKTDRFKAAVTQRSICNWHSFYGTSDIGYFFTYRQHAQADLWDDEDRLLEISPIRHARKVKTPILILHSEQDLRCPMEQAEQWFVALKRLGVETKFIRFPRENHDLSRSGEPKHRLERLEHLIGWFEDRTEKVE